MDQAADYNVWVLSVRGGLVAGAKTLVFNPTTPTPLVRGWCFPKQESLTLALSIRAGVINHLKWTALTGIWSLCSLFSPSLSVFFVVVAVQSTRSSRSLTYNPLCLSPSISTPPPQTRRR